MTRRSGSVIPRGIPFAQIPHALTLDVEVTNAAYRVYGLLMKLANSESRAWPGHRYLEDNLPMTRKTIAGGISNLEDCGWLVVDRSRQAHRYTIVVELARLDLDYTNRSRNDSGGEITPAEFRPLTGVELTPEPAEKLPRTDNHDRQPVKDTSAPNVAWEFLTDPNSFAMTVATAAQRKRVGRIAREINAKLYAQNVLDSMPHTGSFDAELRRRASLWPTHFPDAVMTAEAFEKHFELLGAPPLKRSKSATTRSAAAAAIEALR